MHRPSAAELLGVWERGRDRNAVERTLEMLAACDPAATRAQLCALSVGDCDRRLFELHESLFGHLLRGVADCDRCRMRLEFVLDSRALRGADTAAPAEPLELESGGLRVRFRPPNSGDLLAAVALSDAASVRRAIAERCIVAAAVDAVPVTAAELSDSVVADVANSLSTLDAAADVTLAVSCASCGHSSHLLLDIAAFVWAEIQAAARRLLEQVHALAWAYGWHEHDILAMPPARREFYLERIA